MVQPRPAPPHRWLTARGDPSDISFSWRQVYGVLRSSANNSMLARIAKTKERQAGQLMSLVSHICAGPEHGCGGPSVRDQAGTRPATLYRQRRHWRLHDRFREPPVEPGLLYAMPTIALFGSALAAVPLGVARHTIEHRADDTAHRSIVCQEDPSRGTELQDI